MILPKQSPARDTQDISPFKEVLGRKGKYQV